MFSLGDRRGALHELVAARRLLSFLARAGGGSFASARMKAAELNLWPPLF